MKILISGATGFIGKHLVKKLVEEGNTVHIIVRETSPEKEFPVPLKKVHVYTSVSSLITFMNTEKFDGVIHLASLFLVSHKETDVEPLIQSNILFASTLLEATTKSKTKWFINTGTFTQHCNNKRYSPFNLYSATKQAFEDIATYYRESSDIILVTLKLFDTFGEGDTRPKIFNLWSSIGNTKEPFPMSPGKQILDMNYVGNVVDAYIHMAKLLTTKKGYLYNGKSYLVSSGERMTLQELAKLYESVTKKSLPIVWGGRPYRNKEIMKPWNKDSLVPGWKPKTTIKKALKKMLASEEKK